MKDTFTQFIRLGLVIALLGLLLYWLDAAYFAPRRLPPCVQEELPEGFICPETLLRIPAGSSIVWIDARSLSEYEVKHMELPTNDAFPIRPGAEKDEQIIRASERLAQLSERDYVVVFCSASCSSSKEIAAELRELAFSPAPVYILQGGWDAIRDDKAFVP